MSDELDLELKRLQIETSKFELEAKRLELQSRPRSFFLSAISNPIVIAGAIAAMVTVSTGCISYVLSEHQKQLEEKKTDAQKRLEEQKAEAQIRLAQVNADSQRRLEILKTESSLIMDAVRTDNPDQAAVNLKFLIDAGLVSQSAPDLARYLDSRMPGSGKTLPRPPASPPLNPPRNR
ncbi:hypothetical protein IC762_18840 [Bradyrhizobium genosp. L]|uniref:hypothetical protein n=1 Tax=Bradyrhizobium genosp. L TaxID=83637 RepID=UPI0018A2C276|nr:hypothetical protein [Bradyrhizobium genosp. L]QPF81861.1 hypothetical protein IC762_18840 [Bradyrhizobium genosp. L]